MALGPRRRPMASPGPGPTPLYPVMVRMFSSLPRALHQGTTRQVVISSALALSVSVSICNARQPCNKWTRPCANTPAPPRPHRPLSTLSTVRSDVPSRAEASSRCTARPATTRTMKDPVARTASPYVDPTIKGPRSQQLHSGYSAQARKSKSSRLLCLLPSPVLVDAGRAFASPVVVDIDTLANTPCSAFQHRQQDQPAPRWCAVRPPPPPIHTQTAADTPPDLR